MSAEEVHVADNCVLVDCYEAGILLTITALSIEVIIPDVVLEEFRNIHGDPLDMSVLTRGGKNVGTLPPDGLEEAGTVFQENAPLSFSDAVALVTAERRKCVLLTNDQKLAGVAESRGISTLNILSLLDELLARNVIDPPSALRVLDAWEGGNTWLAPELIADRRKWIRARYDL